MSPRAALAVELALAAALGALHAGSFAPQPLGWLQTACVAGLAWRGPISPAPSRHLGGDADLRWAATAFADPRLCLIGMVLVFSYVLSGSTAEGEDHGIPEKCIRIVGKACSAVFSGKVLALAKVFFTDVLLQKRLYRQSRSRWAIHSLIFYPFVFRFLWGIIALIGSLWKPEWPFLWPMLDKNQPLTAFLFDLTGVILILGIVFALVRGARKMRTRVPDLPSQDRIALALIGGIVLVGFVLEGMRIAMTGFPGGSEWAFPGYGIGELFSQGSHLVNIYGYVWYLHALLSGAFLAYLPFRRLLHIILAPLVLTMSASASPTRSVTLAT